MTYKHILLQDFLESYPTLPPEQEKLEAFRQALQSTCERLLSIQEDKTSKEEQEKTQIKNLIEKTFAYQCEPVDKIDMAILDPNTHKIATIFEFKSRNNKGEFVSSKAAYTANTNQQESTSLECKAFYETILYYLRETQTNNNIRFIILSDTIDFYIIDAKEYRQFAEDAHIKRLFKNCDKKEGNDDSTQRFYNDLGGYLPTLESTLKYTYINLQNITDETLPLLYQAFSPQVLLKQKSYIDANTLNVGFYNELLYILGLEEIETKGKTLIIPSNTKNSLLDSISTQFNLNTSIDSDFETAFSLLTTWNNRILFLRLLDSMLLSFKHIQTSFLSLSSIPNFSTLNTLFFKILAIKQDKRENIDTLLNTIPYLNSSLFDKTELEKQNKTIDHIESNLIQIYPNSILKDKKLSPKDNKLPLLEYLFSFLHAYNFTTTPKDIVNHTKTNHDRLINSAVLGLVFEKLNGYKEGSFYTPSFITSYMCKEALEKIVVQKFNEANPKWNALSLEDIAEEIREEIREARKAQRQHPSSNSPHDTDSPSTPAQSIKRKYIDLLLSIKICDPSVGSGHFLVSALNQMVIIIYELGLFDFEYELELENDEIIIRDLENKIFNYTLPKHEKIESHKIQKILFTTKKEIIESCLFGVDINPNSCEITKLRLWIELLKYSYYKDIEKKELETLPNIDINIKCGNSLVSNIALDITKDSLIKQLKAMANKKASLEFSAELATTANDLQNKLPKKIEEYKNAVNSYKNEINSDFKAIHKETIAKCQNFIIGLFHKMSDEYKAFKLNLSSYLSSYGYNGIDNATIKGQSLDSDIIKSLNNYTIDFNFHKSLDIPKEPQGFVEKELTTLIDSMRHYEELIHDNAFEWRFAFPEVLNSNGNFLGFDLIIGNPPYIRQEEIKHLKPHLSKAFSIYTGTSDIYTYFYEQGYKLLRKNGILSFITSNKWCRAGYGEALRQFLLDKTSILSYTELNGIKVFESASVDTSILSIQNTMPTTEHSFIYSHPKDHNPKDNTPLTPKNIQAIPQHSLSKEAFIFLNEIETSIKHKIQAKGVPLKEWDISINYGIKTGYNEAFIIDTQTKDTILESCISDDERSRTSKLIKPILRGRDIKRYSYEWAGLWIIGTFPALNLNIDEYPAIKNYLESYRPRIDQSGEKGCRKKTSNKWFETQDNIAYYEDFAKEKIVWSEMTKTPCFVYDTNNMLINQTCYFIPRDDMYLCAMLNSKLIYFYMQQIASNLGDGAFRWIKQFVEKLPIIESNKENQATISQIKALSKQILEAKAKDSKADTKELESQIDELVYNLYGLSDSEIAIIEGE